jgi:hypothetical protein
VLLACGAERLGRGHELLVAELLVAELDDVDAAAERRVEQGGGFLAVGARLEDEIETGAREALATGRAVHGSEANGSLTSGSRAGG